MVDLVFFSMKKLIKYVSHKKTCIIVLFLVLLAPGNVLLHAKKTRAGKPITITLGTNLWDISWTNANPWKKNPENAIDSTRINEVSYNPWNEQLLEELKIYSCVRFMDAGRINNQNPLSGNARTWNEKPEVSWTDRNPETNPDQSQMSVYWMIDLCNRLNADMWLCIPELADSTWWSGAADLIKHKLKPELNIYIEYSNEVWNKDFSAYHTALKKGIDLDLWFPKDSQNQDFARDRCAARYQAHVSAKIWSTFEKVFETDKNKIIKVLSGQTSSDWMNAALLHAISDSTVNESGVKPDYFAIATYFGQEIKNTDKHKLKLIKCDINQLENDIVNTQRVIDGSCIKEWYSQMPCMLNDIKIISYEGGQHVLAGADSVSRNPAIYKVYRKFLKMIEKHISGVFCHYVHSGAWENKGAWGAKAYIGQDEKQAHKYRALKDWRNTQININNKKSNNF